MRKSFFISIVMVLLISSTIFSAPMTMAHQGRLLNATGIPSTGLFDLTYRLYATPTGTDILWEETHTVQVTDGLYSVVLGTITPLDMSTMPVHPDFLWMGIQVSSDAELSPRTKLSSVPSAAVALALQGDISTGNGILNMTDSLGDTTIAWDANARRGIIKNLHPPGNGTSTAFDPGNITLTNLVGDTAIALRIDNGDIDGDMEIKGSVNATNIGGGKFLITNSVADTTFSILTDSSGTALYMNKGELIDAIAKLHMQIDDTSVIMFMNKAELIDAIASDIDLSIVPSGVRKRAARTGRNPQTGATIKLSSTTTLNDTTGVSVSLRRLDDDDDDDTVFDMIVDEGGASLFMNKAELIDAIASSASIVTDTSKAQMNLSKADSKRALESLVNNSLARLSFIDSTLNDSGLIGISLKSSGGEISLLNTQGDSTVTIRGGGGGGGRLFISTEDAGAGAVPGSVEIADLDSDGQMDIRVDGDLQIGTSTGTNIISVVQSSATDPIADAWTTYSSRRWKENIKTLTGALGKVQQLRGVEYNWKADGKHDIGLIAEEVGEIIPEVVVFEENGTDAKSVDYPRLVALLIEASKEQQTKLNSLQTEIDELKALVNKLAQNNLSNGNSSYSSK
ncbi:MAG: hypothetical protein DWP97_14445 [Calditrichaeota bacterium]|nr:MAG: hypothetical protein DWP97_14445 [Calditrichota bacterium]